MTHKICLLFPGQGSQFVGMGKNLAENFAVVRHTLEEACDVLQFNLQQIMFDGPADILIQTEYAQPALVTLSTAIWRLVQKEIPHILPVCGAGHSLGEYSALHAAGVLSFQDALKAASKRGQSMPSVGKMAAILGLSAEDVKKCLPSSEDVDNQCVIANDNSESQIVISGHDDALMETLQRAREMGAKRCVPLKVSGAFHSPLMHSATHVMGAYFDNLTWNHGDFLNFPVITNVSAKAQNNVETLRQHLIMQIESPVRWHETMHEIVAHDITLVLELGPGSVLTNLMRRHATYEGQAFNIEDVKSFDFFLKSYTI